MNINKQDIDALNTLVTISIDKTDYMPTVEKALTDYKKKASVPGFRKGFVPMSLIKKQYEKPIIIDEVNKLLQDTLNKFIVEEKLDILGNPIPKANEDFSWENDSFSFDFEVGLAPKFEVNLDAKSDVKLYKIVVDDEFINEELQHIQKQYGKLVTEAAVSETGRVIGTFEFEYKGEKKENTATIELEQIKGEANQNKFIGKKVGDVIELKTKDLFVDDHLLMHALQLDHDDAHGFDVEVKFTVTEISNYELAELNQELFDKLFGEGKVESVDALKAEIKTTAERDFSGQAEQKFLNDTTDFLLKNTHFDLPSEFLKRWLQITSDKEVTFEQASEDYNKSEKGLRYQLIESQIAKENNLVVTMDDLRTFTKNLLGIQYAQYGSDLINDEFLDGVANRVLENQDEVKRVSEQVMTSKLIALYKEKMNYNTKEVTYKAFIEESYK